MEELIEKYDLWMCIQCGKCTGGCPISMKSTLNIRKLVYETILELTSLDEICERDELWDCTTCGTCLSRCPKEVKNSDLVIGLRGIAVEGGRIPKTAMEALESVYKHGNPWGRTRAKRSEWTAGLNIKSLAEGEKADILYYVGCTASYDPRIQEVAKALVHCFQKADVDFGILGNEETCSGNEVRRMGEEGLFEMLVEENLEKFEKYDISKMVTTSPHDFNAFKNEYEFEGEVQHYTQFISDLIDREKLTFSNGFEKTVTYQDPCYLGRQNDVYEEPRKIIESIPGVRFVEMDRSRFRSLCCEGGGGRMWVEGTEGERLAERRVRDAADVGAEVIATACPFCLINLEDAVKTTGYEDKIEIMDIMEIVMKVS
jgi:Fe-S oxidoreductase